MENGISSKNQEPVTIIACKVLQSALEEMLPERMRRRTQIMDYDLHRSPARMNLKLQAAIDAIGDSQGESYWVTDYAATAYAALRPANTP